MRLDGLVDQLKRENKHEGKQKIVCTFISFDQRLEMRNHVLFDRREKGRTKQSRMSSGKT